MKSKLVDSRNADIQIFVGGEIIPRREAKVPVFDCSLDRTMELQMNELTPKRSRGHRIVAGYRIVSNDMQDGKCPGCGIEIPVWTQELALAFKPRT